MNQITGTIQNIFSDRPLQEDEYRNESDNLIHCAKCKTPRQHHFQGYSVVSSSTTSLPITRIEEVFPAKRFTYGRCTKA